MTWQEPVQLNNVVRLFFYWEDSSGNKITTLSPAPTLTLVDPSLNVSTGLALTQVGTTPFRRYDLTCDETGAAFIAYGVCTDPSVSKQETDALVIVVGNDGTVSTFAGDAATQLDAIQTKTDLIGTATAFANVAIVDDNIEIVRGDDYSDSQGRALTWTITGAPDLTTATAITLRVGRWLTASGSAVDADTLKVPLTSEQSILPPVSAEGIPYQIEALYPGSIAVTVVKRGLCTVIARVPGQS